MRQRRLWTAEEDKVLKTLREEQKIKKWSTIAKMMQEDYSLPNRTGKQCRQRYFNHLDSQIRHQQWTEEQQRTLWEMHSQFGNRWTLMTSRIKGRSQNCIKNHFYSKLRKAVRRLNKFIIDRFKGQFRQIKTSLLYKILQSAEDKFRPGKSANIESMDLATSIKNRLFLYETERQERAKELEIAKSLIRDINALQERFKHEEKHMKNTSGFLDPRSAKLMDQSFQSQDNLSFYSSTSYNSSFQHSEEDDDQDIPSQSNKRTLKLLNKMSLEEKKNDSNMDEEEDSPQLHFSWTQQSRFAPVKSAKKQKQNQNFLGGQLAQSLTVRPSRSQKTFSVQLNNDDKVSDIEPTRGQNERCISDIAKNQDSQNQWDELDNNFIYPKSTGDEDICCNDDFFGDPSFGQFQIVVNSPKVPSDDGKEILGYEKMEEEQGY